MHIGKIRNIIKPAVACIALAVFAAPGTVVSAAALEREGAPLDVVADWKFQQAHSTGSIDGGDLVIKDMSGNGNDLHMQTYGKNDYKLSDYVNWSSNSMNGDGGGSLKLNGDSDLAHKKDHPEQRDPKGADFITASALPSTKSNLPTDTPWSSCTTFPMTSTPVPIRGWGLRPGNPQTATWMNTRWGR